MSTLIIFVSLIVVLGFFIQALFLHGSAKLFKVKKSNYKTSLLITLVVTVSALITQLITNLINIEVLTVILGLLIPFVIFYILAKKYYLIRVGKSIGIYITFVVLSSIIFGLIVFLTRSFVVQPYVLSGNSMSPTLQSGEYLLFSKYDKNYERNEIIAFENEENYIIISRIIGLPGEKIQIESGQIFINEEELETQETPGEIEVILKEKEYFILSDNRAHSTSDSRTYGPVKAEDIIGTYLASYWSTK